MRRQVVSTMHNKWTYHFPPPPFWGVRVTPGLWPLLWKYMQSLHFSLIPRAMLLKDFTSGRSNMLDWSRVRSQWASGPLCWNLVGSLSLHTIKRVSKDFFSNQYLCYLNARIWDFRAKWGQDLGLKTCAECGKVVCREQPPGLLDWGKIWVGIYAWGTLFGTLYKNWNTGTGTCPLLCLCICTSSITILFPWTFCNSFPESYQWPFPGHIGMLMFTAILNHYCFQKGSYTL